MKMKAIRAFSEVVEVDEQTAVQGIKALMTRIGKFDADMTQALIELQNIIEDTKSKEATSEDED